MKNFKLLLLYLSIILTFSLCGCSDSTSSDNATVKYTVNNTDDVASSNHSNESPHIDEDTSKAAGAPSQAAGDTSSDAFYLNINNIPEFTNAPYCVINDNTPSFDESDHTTSTFEKYSSLDSLGRCGVAYANICKEIMPTEERDSIGQVKPSGWKTIKYDIVDGKYLYNRCHLIGYQLSGENANEKNLITGTRYMNVEGMLPFENMVADYVKETDNHVLYRVTPIYDGDNLVASGVQMEAYSVEDKGDGICFNVYVYNNQPGIAINYANGNSSLADNIAPENSTNDSNTYSDYIINKNNGKFHHPTCSSVSKMKDSNKIEFSGNRDDLISQGYSPCGSCHP